MKKRVFVIGMTIGIVMFVGLWPFMVTAENTKEKVVLYPARVDVKPKIDGVLDEKVWQTQPLERDLISYSPFYGKKLPHRTLVWMSYDDENLYFAFLCLDPEPEKIKTSLTKRDNIFYDDWVGLSLDALGTKQTAWALFVNPSGVQGDILDSAATGSDESPDFVWNSAGKVTDKGYQVEIGIPLRSIAYKSGKTVKMGVLFWRNITREGIRGCWPKPIPGGKVFATHTPIIYKDLKQPLKLEILPDLTYSNNQERLTPDDWGERDILTGFGVGLKYGITSSITAELTVNPDFSQVESDTFQVEVNQRYPLFYTEKRPFFMEGSDVFKFFTFPEGYFPYAIHTRRIVNPAWGARLTGSVGKTAFGILAAGDEFPGAAWATEENLNKDKKAFFGIARGKYSLGKDNYVGFLYNGHEFDDQYNRVFGMDMLWRFLENHRIHASFQHSISSDNSAEGEKDNIHGNNFNFMYYYTSRPLWVQLAFEHMDTDFRMDTAYMQRTGINHTYLWSKYNVFPKKISWITQISTGIEAKYLHDLYTDMDDSQLEFFVVTNFPKSAYVAFKYLFAKESWEGHTFDLGTFIFYFQVQLTKWFRTRAILTYGDKIFYGGDPAFTGKGYEITGYLDLQPTEKLNQYFSLTYSDLVKDNDKVYDVSILFSRTTYQFNKYLFLRGIVQYNSYQKKVLTDLLASFTLIPGTVVHVGYGGLYENRDWQDGQWVPRIGDRYHTKRSFFAKISYLWRL
jgi:hypothetical protein